MPDEPVFVRGGQQCHVVQEKTHCYSVLRGQHSTGLVVWSSPPLPGLVKVPGAIHPEMRVQASSIIETGEKVLVDAVYAKHGPPRQIMFGEPRMAQFPPGRRWPLGAAAIRLAAKYTVSPSGIRQRSAPGAGTALRQPVRSETSCRNPWSRCAHRKSPDRRRGETRARRASCRSTSRGPRSALR